MRPQKSSIRQIKRVLFIAGRVVRWGIQSIEAVPLRFDIGTFGKSEAHSPKDLNCTLMHLVKRMQRTDLVRRPRKRDVDLGERARFFFYAELCAARFECRGDGIANFVEQLPDDG